MKQPAPFLRGNVYYLTQRVPKRFANVETRKMIWQSLDTDSLSAATAKATQIWNEMIAAWQARQDGLSEDAERRFTAAKRIAQRHGLAYLPQDQVLALPTDDLLARLEAIPEVAGQPDKVEAAALLGKVPEPKITVSGTVDLYICSRRTRRWASRTTKSENGKSPLTGR